MARLSMGTEKNSYIEMVRINGGCGFVKGCKTRAIVRFRAISKIGLQLAQVKKTV